LPMVKLLMESTRNATKFVASLGVMCSTTRKLSFFVVDIYHDNTTTLCRRCVRRRGMPVAVIIVRSNICMKDFVLVFRHAGLLAIL
jgi:hypothetical protein